MFNISNISRLRIRTDGDGIRTLIVTTGCPLRCMYCINPHTWDGSRPARPVTADKLYQMISLDRPYFMATGGGVTFGGGEPLQYANDIRLFKERVEGDFTVFAETSLHVSQEKVVSASSCIDRFIVDIKTSDSGVYHAYTGGELSIVRRNLELLLDKVGSDKIEVRVPVIPGYVKEEEQLKTKDCLQKMGITRIDLFTYLVGEDNAAK